jgi:hypothetical protein
VAVPRDHEQHALLGPGDQPDVEPQPVAWHQQVHALGHADGERRLRPLFVTVEAADLVGPHPGGADHAPRVHDLLASREQVAHANPGQPAAVPEDLGRLDARQHGGPVLCGGTRDHHHQARVVHLRVVVADGARERVRSQRGRQVERAAPGEVPVHRQGTRTADAVVEQHARTDVGAFPHPVCQRVQERHRPHQVRREAVQQQAAFLERFAHQPEVTLLQVTQPAVDELAGPARRACRPVPRLDECDRKAAGRRVECGTGAHHATTHDEHVELGLGEGTQRRVPVREVQLRRHTGNLSSR